MQVPAEPPAKRAGPGGGVGAEPPPPSSYAVVPSSFRGQRSDASVFLILRARGCPFTQGLPICPTEEMGLPHLQPLLFMAGNQTASWSWLTSCGCWALDQHRGGPGSGFHHSMKKEPRQALFSPSLFHSAALVGPLFRFCSVSSAPSRFPISCLLLLLLHSIHPKPHHRRSREDGGEEKF